MNKRIIKLLGGVLIFSGITIWFNPNYYSSRFGITFDFSGVKWPFGGVLFILGGLFIWSSFRKKALDAEKKSKDEKRVLMCPKCVQPIYKKDCPDLICPACESPLEDLSGFYERHPELKDKGIQPSVNKQKSIINTRQYVMVK